MSEDSDSKMILAAIVIAALVVCAFVWFTTNGVSSQLGDVKNQVLRNTDAINALAAASGGAGAASATAGTGTAGGASEGGASPTPIASAFPQGISQLPGAVSCSANGKPIVQFFTDPYCPACAASEQYVNDFVDSFASVANITYEVVLTHSGGLVGKYGEDNVTLAHEYFLCVQDQGLDKIQAFKKLFYANLTEDATGSDYLPFTATQLAGFAKQAGADQSKIDSCLPGAKARVNADVQDALNYGGGTYSTPTVVVDCLYTGHSGYAANAVCFGHPNLAQCKAQ